MTRDELRAWAMRDLHDAARVRDFATGVLAVAAGTFDEAKCGPAGFAEESVFCEGGREAMQRLAEPAPIGRIAHGAIVTTPGG